MVRVCRLCGGQLAKLGTLGSLDHYRCIACGMQFNKTHRERKRQRLGGGAVPDLKTMTKTMLTLRNW